MECITEVMKIDFKVFDPNAAEKIRDILSRDGVIIYPTETLYGLGGDCFSQKVIKRIFAIKFRSLSKPLSVVVCDLDMVDKIVREKPLMFNKLAQNFWPGALTLILKAASLLPAELLGHGGTVAVRQTGLTWLRRLISYCGFPIISTSANLSGRKSILDPDQAYDLFRGKVDLVIDGGRLAGDQPSTIVDLTLPEPKILREGVISKEELIPYLKG
jgi:L-threonylcarbamoyladenylate synthase